MSKQQAKAKINFEVNDDDIGIIDDGQGNRCVLIKEFDLNKMHPYGPDDIKFASKIVVIGKPGCFAAGTKVLMFSGDFKNVEDIREGDIIMGDDSTKRTVLQTASDKEEMFEIITKYNNTLLNDEKYIVNKSHNLVLISDNDFVHNSQKISKGTVVEITVSDYLSKDDVWKSHFLKFRKHLNISSNDSSNNLSKDPYLFGNNIQEYISTLNTVQKSDDDPNYNIAHLKLSNCIIPPNYKFQSLQNRAALLAGILETVHKVKLGKNEFSEDNFVNNIFYNKNEDLINEVIWLARSLGLLSYKRNKTSCSIHGNLKILPFKRYKYINDISKINYIKNLDDNTIVAGEEFSVKSIGEGIYYGFTIDGNHRFLLNSFDVVRNTGKSTLIENILLYKWHVCPVGQFYNGSEDVNNFYKNIATDITVFNKMDLKAQENFLKRQSLARQYLPNPWAFIVLDDVTDDPSLMKKPLINTFYKRGRHFNLIHILALQYPMDISPGLRTCVDYVFILATAVLGDRKKIYENFASGSIPTFQDFCDIMDVITEDHTALVIDNLTDSNKIEDRVFYFKADPNKIPPGWKIGCPESYEFQEERYDPNYQPSII